MYIVELLINFFKPRKYTGSSGTIPVSNPSEDFVPVEDEDCNHVFLPLDSSNENFACKYCGLIVKAENLKKINYSNPFNH